MDEKLQHLGEGGEDELSDGFVNVLDWSIAYLLLDTLENSAVHKFTERSERDDNFVNTLGLKIFLKVCYKKDEKLARFVEEETACEVADTLELKALRLRHLDSAEVSKTCIVT